MQSIKSLHPTDINRKLKVAAYARISKDKADLESSLEAQINYYTTLILENPDWEFAGIYADDGISGATIYKRNQFQLMIQKAFAKEIDIILVKSISRFARNVVDLLGTVHELRDADVEIIFEKEGISSFDTNNDLYLTLYSQFAEEELISMSKNVKWRVNKDMQAGKYYIDANTLFGYKFDDDRNVVINEKEARWVKDIFEMYAAGKNTAAIADYLEEHNVRTTTGLCRWSGSCIRRILKNEKYKGVVVLQKSYVVDPITQRRAVNNGNLEKYIIENGIEPIVSKELWEACQLRMAENKERYKLQPKNNRNLATPYTAFGFCPYCRQSYFKKMNRHTRILYCSSNKARALCKESESVFIDDLDKIIAMQINILKENEKELKELLTSAFQNKDYEKLSTAINEEKEKIEDLHKQLEECDSLKVEGIDYLRAEIKKQIKEHENRKIVLENERLTLLKPESIAEEVIQELKKAPEADSIGDYDFRKIFKNMIVINRDKLLFVIGSADMSKVPLNPYSLIPHFNGTYQRKERSMTYLTQFGIYINK